MGTSHLRFSPAPHTPTVVVPSGSHRDSFCEDIMGGRPTEMKLTSQPTRRDVRPQPTLTQAEKWMTGRKRWERRRRRCETADRDKERLQYTVCNECFAEFADKSQSGDNYDMAAAEWTDLLFPSLFVFGPVKPSTLQPDLKINSHHLPQLWCSSFLEKAGFTPLQDTFSHFDLIDSIKASWKGENFQ